MSADQRPRRASPTASKSPASVRLQSRPPWNSFSARPAAEDSPGTSRHRLEVRPVSPVIRTATTHRRLQPSATLPLTPHSNSNSAAAASLSNVDAGLEQLQLFGQLQNVVVRLSQAAVSDKSKLAHMQQQLDAYVTLVKDQDRLIDELRELNAKLQRERDALLEFRDGAALLERSPPLSQTHTLEAFHPHATPKTKTFVQSLVDQLREEKRVRLQVEEQSSRMIGEQQITIHRLEDRLRQQMVPHTSPTRVRTPRHGATPPPLLPLPASQQQQQQQQQQRTGTSELQPTPVAEPSDPPQYSASYSPSGTFFRATVDEGGVPARSPSVGGVVISVDNATEILEKIKLRHGLR